MKLIFRYSLLFIVFCVFIQKINFAQQLNILTINSENSEQISLKTQNFTDSVDAENKLNQFLLSEFSKGFYSAGYDSIVYAEKLVNAYYNSGQKYILKELDFEIDSLAKTLNFKDFDKEAFFDPSFNHEKYLKVLADKGYPFAKFEIENFEIENDSISAKIKLDSGEYFVFDSIIIKSEAKIKPYYINKVLNIKKNDAFSYSKIKNINKSISGIPFLQQTRAFQLAFGENKSDILLYLKNKKAGSFSGVLGILPNNITTGKLLLTGDLQLNLVNSFARGEVLSVNWKKYDAFSQNLETDFLYPYIFKSDFGIGLGFNLEKKDSTWLNTLFDAQIIYGNSNATGFNLFLENKNSIVLSSATDGLSSVKSKLFGFGFRLINIDNILTPNKGIVLFLNSGFGLKNEDFIEEDKKNIFQTKNKLELTAYLPIYRSLIFKFKSNTSSIFSKKLFENELDRIGGLKTIRGFDDLSLPASSYSIASTEILYRIEENSAVFALCDFAYFEKRNTINKEYNYALSFGAGIELNTGAGIFSLVWAVGKLNSNSFMFNASKIHFGYRNMI